MKMQPTKKILVRSAVLLLPCLLGAKETLETELSLGLIGYDTDNPSGKFGRYNGIADDTERLFGGVKLDYNAAEYYLYLSGADLGLSPSYIGVQGGRHGTVKLSLEHRYIDVLMGANAKTPYDGVGSDTLTLPGSFVTAPATTGMTNLADNLKTIELRTKRHFSHAGIFYTPTERWQLTLDAYRKTKEGTAPMGGSIGKPGRWGYPTVILPAPVDEATNILHAAVGYNAPKYQLEVSYHLSEFKNRYDAFTWDTPFDAATVPPGNPYTYPDSSLTSLSPDNSHHKLTLSGAYNFTETTRLVLSTNYGISEQDDTLLGYTINPDSNVSTPLTRDSAKTKVETLRAHLQLTSRPLPKLRLKLSYNHDKRENKTPVALWQRVVNDTGDQPSISSDDATYNHLYNKTQDRIKLKAGYYLGKGTRFNMGYRFENLDRSDRPVKETREHSVDAGMHIGGYSAPASLSFALKHDRRRAPGEFDAYSEYANHHTDEYIATVNPSEQFDTHPLLRQFDVADRDRNTLDLKLNFYPANDIAVGLYGLWTLEEYPHSDLGLSSNDKQSATLDVSYSPTKAWTLFGTYNKALGKFEVLGRSFSSAGPPGTKANTANDSDNDWAVTSKDDIDTITLGTKVSLLRDTLGLRVKGYYGKESNNLSFTTGSNLTATPLPEDKAVLKGAEVEGNYALSDAANVRMGITYEKYESAYWSRDGMEPGSDDISDMLALLSPNIDYSVYTFYALLNYKW